MSEYVKPHIPRVVIKTSAPDQHGFTPSIFSRVEVDGVLWAVTDYTVKGKVEDVQVLTLSVIADVTVEHP